MLTQRRIESIAAQEFSEAQNQFCFAGLEIDTENTVAFVVDAWLRRRMIISVTRLAAHEPAKIQRQAEALFIAEIVKWKGQRARGVGIEVHEATLKSGRVRGVESYDASSKRMKPALPRGFLPVPSARPVDGSRGAVCFVNDDYLGFVVVFWNVVLGNISAQANEFVSIRIPRGEIVEAEEMAGAGGQNAKRETQARDVSGIIQNQLMGVAPGRTGRPSSTAAAKYSGPRVQV